MNLRLEPTIRSRPTARRGFGIWSYRSLIWNFTQRDLKTRFKGTALGWAWSAVMPIATLLIYSLVFSVIFRAVPPDFGNGDKGIFTVWLFAGLIPWAFLSLTIGSSISALVGTGALLQKVYFPSYVPTLAAMGAILVQTLIEVGIYAVVLVLVGNFGPSWLLVPLLLAIFIVFVASVALTLALYNVYYRDVAYLTGVVLQLLFFLTPILYTVDMVPEDWSGIPLQQLILLNPISQFVEAFRQLTYGLEVPAAMVWVSLMAWTLLALAVATLVYRRRGLDVGEYV